MESIPTIINLGNESFAVKKYIDIGIFTKEEGKYKETQTIHLEGAHSIVNLGNESFAVKKNNDIGIFTKEEGKCKETQTIHFEKCIYDIINLGNESFAVKQFEGIKIYTKEKDKYKETEVIYFENTVYSIVNLENESFVIRANDRKIEIYKNKKVDPVNFLKDLIGKHIYDKEITKFEIKRELISPEFKENENEENFEKLKEAVNNLDALFATHEQKRKTINVKFAGESGIDAGGLKRDFFRLSTNLLLRVFRKDLMYHKKCHNDLSESDFSVDKIRTNDVSSSKCINEFSYSYYSLSKDERELCGKAMNILGRIIALTLKDPTIGISMPEKWVTYAVSAALGILPSSDLKDSLWRLKKLQTVLSNIDEYEYLIKECIAKLDPVNQTDKEDINKLYNELKGKSNLFVNVEDYKDYINFGKKSETDFQSKLLEKADLKLYKNKYANFLGLFTGLNYCTTYGLVLCDKINNILSSMNANPTEGLAQFLSDFLIPREFANRLRKGFFRELNLSAENETKVLNILRWFSPEDIENFLMASGSNFIISFVRSDPKATGETNEWLMDNLESEIKNHMEDVRAKVDGGDVESSNYLKKLLEWFSGGFVTGANLKIEIDKYFYRLTVPYAVHTCFNKVNLSLAFVRAFLFAPFYASALKKEFPDLAKDCDIKAKLGEILKEEWLKGIHESILQDSGFGEANTKKHLKLVVDYIDGFWKNENNEYEEVNKVISYIDDLLKGDNVTFEQIKEKIKTMFKIFIEHSFKENIKNIGNFTSA